MKNIIKLTAISAITAVFFSGCIMHTLGTTTVGVVSGKKVAKDLWYWGNGQKPKGLLDHDGWCQKNEVQMNETIAKNIERAKKRVAQGKSNISGPTKEHPYIHITDTYAYYDDFRTGVYIQPYAIRMDSYKCDVNNKKLYNFLSTNPNDMDSFYTNLATKKERRLAFVNDLYKGMLKSMCLAKASHYAMDEGGYEIIKYLNNINTGKPVAIMKYNYDDCYEYLYSNDYYMFDDPKKMEEIKQRKAQLKEPRIQIFEENLFVGIE